MKLSLTIVNIDIVMINRYLSLLLAVCVPCLVTTTVYGEQNKITSKINFFCKNNEGNLSTMVKNIDGSLQPIFHWKQAAFESDTNLSELCEVSSVRLNEYTARNSDNLSSLNLIPRSNGGLSVICLSEEFENCDFLLFATASGEDPLVDSYDILKTILDDEFKDNVVENRNDTILGWQIFLDEPNLPE